MKSEIAPTAVETHQGAGGLLTPSLFAPTKDFPIEIEIDKLVTNPAE